MGVDCRMYIPYSKNTDDKFVFCNTVIELNRCRDLWPKFDTLTKERQGVRSWGSREPDGWGKIETDPYGSIICAYQAHDIAEVIERHESPINNRPAAAYLRALPHDWPVILYWH